MPRSSSKPERTNAKAALHALHALRGLATLAAVCLLALTTACGDSINLGPGSNTAISGTAATGAPLANADISLLCNAGGTPITGKTGADGKYTATLPDTGCDAPYIFKATGINTTVSPTASITLYGFADAAGNINVTPMTDAAARFATSGDPAAAYALIAQGSKKASDYWNPSTAAAAKTQLAALLAQLGVSSSGISDLLHAPFDAKKGDKLDDLLESIKLKRGEVTLAALVEFLAKNGGTAENQPWKVLFPAGTNTLVVNATDCTSSGSLPDVTGTTAVITLVRGSSSVTLSVRDGAGRASSLLAVGVGNSYFDLESRSGAGNFVDVGFGSNSNGSDWYANFYAPSERDLIGAFEAANAVGPVPGEQSFRFEQRSLAGAYNVTCNKVSQPFTRASLPNFYPQARLASYLAGSPTAVVSSAVNRPEGCSLPPSGTYTYAVSTLGEVRFDGTPLSANWLDFGLANQNSYSERTGYNNAAVYSSGMDVAVSRNKYFRLYRYFDRGAGFEQLCNHPREEE